MRRWCRLRDRPPGSASGDVPFEQWGGSPAADDLSPLRDRHAAGTRHPLLLERRYVSPGGRLHASLEGLPSEHPCDEDVVADVACRRRLREGLGDLLVGLGTVGVAKDPGHQADRGALVAFEKVLMDELDGVGGGPQVIRRRAQAPAPK